MRSKLIIGFAALFAAAALVPVASATTAPALTVKIRVFMSDTGVTLSQLKAIRGWYANFIVVNRGAKAHKFEIGGLTTPVLQPGTKHILKIELALRGTVTYEDLLNSKNRASKGTFSVI